jgi:hypothetical protein
VAGDLEDRLADAIADAWMTMRRPAGLAKAERNAERGMVRKAAREVVGELVTPHFVRLASIAERIEWLEQQQAERSAGYGGGRRD